MEELKTQNGGFILIVEDDRGTSELEAQRLEALGLRIRKASTPAETLDILKSESPALMVLDYSFPDMNALELITRLQKDSIPVPPFIMVTGRGDEIVAVTSMKAGALDYIVKDAAFLDNLLLTAKKALEKSELQLKLKKTEAALRKSLRLYNFLAQVNLAVSREKDKRKLFAQICSVAVSSGGFRMAWIGVPEKDAGRVFPECSAGYVDGYLDSIKIGLTEGPNSKGPTGSAVSHGRISVISDVDSDPVMAPWREKALERGYRSAAAIPLNESGRPAAVLTLYSGEAGFFTDEEQKLLTEIAGDISLALDAISSEEKSAASQMALERTSSQLTHLMEANPVLIFKLRLFGGRLLTEWVSGDVQGITGYEAAEVLHPAWLEANLHPLDKQRVPGERAALLKNGSTMSDFRVKRKGNGYIWVHGQLKMVSKDEVIGSWTDITLLKQSEERFQELFMEAPIGYQSLDTDGKILAVNNTWGRTFGREVKEVPGRGFAEFLAPGSREIFKESFVKLKDSGSLEPLELEVLRPDGGSRRLCFNIRAAHNQDGTFKQAHCVFSDITDTWKAREQTDLLGQAVRSSFNEIYIFDPESFNFIFANYGAVRNLGFAPEELENLTPWDLEHEYTKTSFLAAIAPLLKGRQTRLIFESAHTRKDGTTYPVEVRLQLVETGKKRVFLAVVNDITERKKNERILSEMAVMQRMESLGQLAGGIAHDFNNMLTGIMSNISLLEARCARGENEEILRETVEAAKSAQSLTANLLAFSKGGKPVKSEFNLKQALLNIFKLATSGTSASCEIQVPDGLWSVEGDENQVKQTVNNLLINSLQAMPPGGKLRLQAQNTGKETRPPEPLPVGEYVRLTISDNGIGIPEKNLARVFEPYFTTKNRGHGLGLSMAWSVVKNHGGHITISSKEGQGTTFEIYLPATGRISKAAGEARKDIIKGTGRILVLEDEEVVSTAMRRMLSELGYTCEIVTDGQEAVRRYGEEEKKGKPFAAVIMDLTIPGGRGGKWAVLQLREAFPRAKVIVSSGYSDDSVMADFKACGFDAVLPKPYRYEDLSEVLSGLLVAGAGRE